MKVEHGEQPGSNIDCPSEWYDLGTTVFISYAKVMAARNPQAPKLTEAAIFGTLS